MSCSTPKDSGEDRGISSSVPVLEPASSSSILGGPPRHGMSLKAGLLVPRAPWERSPPTFMQSQQALIVGSAYWLNSSRAH